VWGIFPEEGGGAAKERGPCLTVGEGENPRGKKRKGGRKGGRPFWGGPQRGEHVMEFGKKPEQNISWWDYENVRLLSLGSMNK